MFHDLWKLAEALCYKVFVEVADPNCVPVYKRRKTVRSKYLMDSLVGATTGCRCTEAGTTKQELRGVYYEVLDRFIQEMKRRLVNNSEILRGLLSSDPLNEDFLNEEKVLNFCTSFIRFNFNVDSLKAQLPVDKNLIKAEKIYPTTNFYEYLQSMEVMPLPLAVSLAPHLAQSSLSAQSASGTAIANGRKRGSDLVPTQAT
ncbi:hypothetical protein Fcan01_15521 [Folsomia candida]|uniref:Uncharacterized protein n=1 Tax=Folsomia candida TaxID=158441 RepID=A0A226DYL3_FOLCA|nr:hypothetical protein Fcan01_15521 [Folsomia candida]